ncbi:unnamed protein product [Ambrosiozyma monospora]|uniref:Unnamed protein product n=1 Tax=Ambrosiozyma monospora TaxID=43982 RepID=A0A9W6YZC8_AMBMO|nr:unnamed protein product [Ambrosiozyma monospora]
MQYNPLLLTISLPAEIQFQIFQLLPIKKLLPLLSLSDAIYFVITRKLVIKEKVQECDIDDETDVFTVTPDNLYAVEDFVFQTVDIQCNITDDLLKSRVVNSCHQLILHSDYILSSVLPPSLVTLLHSKPCHLKITTSHDLNVFTSDDCVHNLYGLINDVQIDIDETVSEPQDDLDTLPMEQIQHVDIPQILNLPVSTNATVKRLFSNTINIRSISSTDDILDEIVNLELAIQTPGGFSTFDQFDFLSQLTKLKQLKIKGEFENTLINSKYLSQSISELSSLDSLHLENIHGESLHLCHCHNITHLTLTSCNFAKTKNNLQLKRILPSTSCLTKLTMIDCQFNVFYPVKLPTQLDELYIEFNTPTMAKFAIEDLTLLKTFHWYNYSIEFNFALPPNIINLCCNVSTSVHRHQPHEQHPVQPHHINIPSSVKHLDLDIQLQGPLQCPLALPHDLECLILHSKHLELDLNQLTHLSQLHKLVKLELWDKNHGFSMFDTTTRYVSNSKMAPSSSTVSVHARGGESFKRDDVDDFMLGFGSHSAGSSGAGNGGSGLIITPAF